MEERADGLRRGRHEGLGRLAHAGSIIHNTHDDLSREHLDRSSVRTPCRRRRRQHGQRHRTEDGHRRLQRDARRPRRREGRARPEHHRQDARRRRAARHLLGGRGGRDSRSGSPARRASRISPTSIWWSRLYSRISTSRRRVFRRLDEVCRPRRDPGDQHLVLRRHRARQPRRRGPSASSDCTTSIIRPRTGWSRSSPGGRPTRTCIAARGAFRKRSARPRLPRAIPTASSSIGSSCRG